MSTDVMKNPPTVTTSLTWYRPTDTTPFAVAGHEGTVLAVLTESKYGPGVQEAWFLGGKWEDSEGADIADDDILAFAIPEAPDLDEFAARPFDGTDSPERLASELETLLPQAGGTVFAQDRLLQRIATFLRALQPSEA